MFRFIAATLCLVFLLLAGSVFGGVWVWLAFAYVTVFTYALDRATPHLLANVTEDMEFPAADPLLVILALAQFAVLSLSVQMIALGQIALSEKIALFLAVSIFAGQVGHPVAHELIHRGNRVLRALGVASYTSMLIGQHVSSHRLVHHVHVATDKDPASAKKGQGFWRYVLRAWVQSYFAGMREESKRRNIKRTGLHPYLIYALGAVASILWAFALAGRWGAVIWVLIATYSQIQIFLSDYVQHYGLRRKVLESGKAEPVGPQHSWNTPHQFSGALLLNAPRHSDHHVHPSRPYPSLRLDPHSMPILPYSIPVMGAIALLPPLWRKLMDKRVETWSRT